MKNEAKLLRDIVASYKEPGWDPRHLPLMQALIDVMLDFPEKPADYKPIILQPRPLYEKVILLSGGFDSTICWYLNEDCFSKLGLFVDTRQIYSWREKRALEMLKIPFVETGIDFKKKWNHIIPCRNFSIIAEAEAYTDDQGEIWIGVVSGETSGNRGDKSRLFFDLVQDYIYRIKRKRISIKTIEHKTKNDWLKWYLDKYDNLDILKTVTCFGSAPLSHEEDIRQCGECQACVRKWIQMRYCGLTAGEKYFWVNPYQGGFQYIEKYKKKFREALANNDFEHYSKERCEQDLKVILDYEVTL